MWKCEIHEIRVQAMFRKFAFRLSCKSRQNISLYIVGRVYAWVGTNRTEQPIFQQLSHSLKSSLNSRPKPTIRFQSLSNHINFHIAALTHCTELQGMPYTKVHFTPHAFHCIFVSQFVSTSFAMIDLQMKLTDTKWAFLGKKGIQRQFSPKYFRLSGCF